jgi:tetratricopeptide (TPR) repeat protein
MEKMRDDYSEPDPHTGRPGSELFCGVYCGPYLGTFRPASGLISIYAFVWNKSACPLPQDICELYLRLHALQTLVHEVAHHHDECQRQARGRWLKLRKENIEMYAEKMEYEWTRTFVLPYLEATYPRAVRRLRAWVSWHGGIRLPFEFFAGDPRTTCRDGLILLSSDTASSFRSWLDELSKASTLAGRRLAFAWELHFADQYESCLAVVECVLRGHPDNIAARECLADTLVHLDRYDDALAAALHLLAADPLNSTAWQTRADVAEANSDWLRLLSICQDWRTAGGLSHGGEFNILTYEAIAYCALGRIQEMEQAIECRVALASPDPEIQKQRRVWMLRSVRRRAGLGCPD